MKIKKAFLKNYSIEEQYKILLKEFENSDYRGIKSNNIVLKKNKYTLKLNVHESEANSIKINLKNILEMYENGFIEYKNPSIIYVYVKENMLECKNMFTNETYKINSFKANGIKEGYFYSDIMNVAILNRKTINKRSYLLIKNEKTFVNVKRGKDLKFSMEREF